jgi:hypothetical protein
MAIRELWAEDGAHILQPPQEILSAAAVLGFTSTTLQASGHDALEMRVTRAYQEFVAPGEFTFTPRDNAARLGNVVKFNWEMAPPAAVRRQAPAWRSSCSARMAVPSPTTSSSRADTTPRAPPTPAGQGPASKPTDTPSRAGAALSGQGEEPGTLPLGRHDGAGTAAILPVICLAGPRPTVPASCCCG